MTDTLGHLLHVRVHAANIILVAGCHVFKEALKGHPGLAGVCADAGYRKTMEKFVKDILHRTIEISQRIIPGWAVLAKRWVVDRTLAWLNSSRRLSTDYEITIKSAEIIIMISLSADG